MPLFLNHIEGSKAGQLETFDNDHIRIGRQADNDIKFDPQKDISVSGYHAEIYRDGEAFFVKDLQSRNGTFLNSRKIEQPVRLKDGDIIQFSARGPKAVFSTRDPSLPSETALMEPGDTTGTIVSAEEKPKAKAGIWKKMKRGLPVPAAILAFLALLGSGWYLGFSWWVLLIGAAGALLLAGGGYLGWRFWRQRKALRAQGETAREQREISLGRGDKGNLQDLRRKWAEVVRSLRDSKLQRLGDDPLYALPWFLFLGESGCGKSALIRAGRPQSSVATSQEGPTRNCDWWFFDKLLVVDASGRYALQAKASESAGEWQELLSLLKNHRRREPLNGVVIALAADSLASRPVEKFKEQAAQLRERLDEMVQQLGVKFPVYLAITKADLIAGFDDFFDALPDPVKGQAVGYINADSINNSDPSRFLGKAFAAICQRAEHLRLAMLYDEERNNITRGIFLFPGELKSLQSPLQAFVDVLFRPSPYRDAPFFRGLFLASARQSGSPVSRLSRLLGLAYAHPQPARTNRELFLRDIFSTILPVDRALAGSTALGRERHQLTRAAGLIVTVAASLLVCGLFTLSFTNNWVALKRADIAPCVNVAGGPIAQVLRPLDECRQNIEGLTPGSMWKKIAFNFGLGQTRQIGAALQERFLSTFRSHVLNPVDSAIDQSLAARSGSSLLVGSLLQRMDLLARCQEDGGCTDLESADGLNYRTMLAVAQPQVTDGDPAIDRLRRTHQSYLLWQTEPKVLAEMYAKDLERIREWIRRGGLREEAVLESASAEFPPVRASDFWGVNVSLQVDAAYTARAWKEGINPLISGLQKMASEATDVNESVKRFSANYRAQALRQWGKFLGEFPQAEKSVLQKGMRDLALNVVGQNSPYHRVIEIAGANLSVILGDSWQGSDLPPWAATLKQYLALKDKVLQAQKTKQAPQDKGQGREAEALNYLTVYLDAVGQLRAELSSPKKSFESAQKVFEDGEPSSKATHPLLRAYWALGMLRDTIGSPHEQDRTLWILLARPATVTWGAMLEESGNYLQQQWEGILLGVKELDPGPKGGKIIDFVNGPAAAFLSRQGGRWVPRKLFDQSVPFTDAFMQYLSRLRLDAMKPTALQTSPGPEPPFKIVRAS